MIKRTVLALLVLAAVALMGRFVALAASAPAGNSPFAGKFIGLLSPARQGMLILEKVQVKQLGGKQFLVGKIYDLDVNGTQGPRTGHTVWVAFDPVLEIEEFESLEEARKAYQRWQEEETPVPAPESAPVPAAPAPLPPPAPTIPPGAAQ